MPVARLATAALVAVALTFAACGDERARTATVPPKTRPTPPPHSDTPLSEKEAFVVGTAKTAVNVRCRGGQLTEQRVGEVVDELIALARRKPDDLGSAFGEPGDTPRNALRTIAQKLADGGCAPTVLPRVRATLRELA